MALARALAREPAVLLLDEPFAAVDRAVRRRLQNEIDSLRRTLHMPLILVTHDFDDVVRLATHVLMLEHGRAAEYGSLSALTSRPDLSWLHEAVGPGSVFERGGEPHPDVDRGLVTLTFDGGTLVAPARQLEGHDGCPRADPGARSHPGDERPDRTQPSQCPARRRVSAIHDDTTLGHVIVQLPSGEYCCLRK